VLAVAVPSFFLGCSSGPENKINTNTQGAKAPTVAPVKAGGGGAGGKGGGPQAE
jgi:hypothetical protein